MRLTPEQTAAIRSQVSRIYGLDAKVRLFGSRVNDSARGGDFDFYIETGLADPERLVGARIELLAALHALSCFEDEKIDLVVRSPLHVEERPIDVVAREAGVAL